MTTEAETNIVARRVDAYLDQMGFNKSEVARKVGKNPRTFHGMLKGEQRMDADTLRAVCAAIGVKSSVFTDD